MPSRIGCGNGFGLWRQRDRRLDVEEGKEIVEIERLAGDLGDADQELFEQAVQPEERAGEEGKVAERELAVDGAPDDVGVGAVIGHVGERRKKPAPDGALGRQPAVVLHDGVGKPLETPDQKRSEAEQLYFLGGLGTGADVAQIFEFAPLRRAHAAEVIGAGVELRLADHGRDERDEQQQDQPRRVKEKAGGEREDGDDRLALAENLRQQRVAARCLAARALQPVLIFAGFEMPEVEPGRVLHQLHADHVGMQLGEDAVDQRDAAPEQVGGDDQPEFQRQQFCDRHKPAAGDPVGKGRAGRGHPALAHHLVDDQLADIKQQQRLHGAQQPEHDACHRQRRAGAPDLREEALQVPERRQLLAERRLVGGRAAERQAGCEILTGTHCQPKMVSVGRLRNPHRITACATSGGPAIDIWVRAHAG